MAASTPRNRSWNRYRRWRSSSADFEKHQTIPAGQRELTRTLFYFGAACVIDLVRTHDRDARMADETQAVFDCMCREVQDFGIQHMLNKMLDGIAVHVVDRLVVPDEPH